MAITITTTSSTAYMTDKINAIYPAYANGISYRSWMQPNNPPNTSSISTHLREYFPLAATGGTTSTYVWSLQSGSLPAGMSLSENGRLTAPNGLEVEGTYTFTVNVTNNGESASKQLTLEVKPFASKWYRDAKFGVIIHWGRFSEVQITTITGDAEFQARIGLFNANTWADQLVAWGAKILHFTVIWQDSFRNWPSQSSTRYELKSSRDIVGELITACHARGIKVVGYYCPDFQANPISITDAKLPNITWGLMNQELIIELIKKGIDALWFDVGAADETPEVGAQAAWLYRDSLIPQMKWENPDFIFAVNPGVRRGGTKLWYPHADYVIYESVATDSTSATLLEKAIPLDSKKKMAIDVSNMVCKNFGYGPNGPTQPKKDLNGYIENMKKNWDVGATVLAPLPVQASGDLRHPNFASYFDQLGAFVVANQGFSIDPVINESSGNITIVSPSTRARIYYTLNGKQPTDKDYIYMAPIKANRNLRLKTRTKEVNKPLGFVANKTIENITDAVIDGEKVLFNIIDNDTLALEPGNYFRGMLVTVGSSPISINAIGRKANNGVSTTHDLVIRRYYDNYPIYSGTLNMGQPTIGGYQYLDIADVRLEAGMSYVIASKENNTDYFASNAFSLLPPSSDLRIISPAILSPNADKNPVPTTPLTIGQFINLKYVVLDNEKKNDVALGKPVTFTSNTTGNQLGPSGISYAVNATDGDPVSIAQAGGEYAYTINVDLLEIQKVNRIVIKFNPESWAIDFTAYVSLNGVVASSGIVGQRVNNSVKTVVFTFSEVATRFIHIRATKPNGQGQYGGQMSILNLEVYND